MVGRALSPFPHGHAVQFLFQGEGSLSPDQAAFHFAPMGLFEHPTSQLGNQFAMRSAFAVRMFLELGGTGSVENPASSYLWQVLDELLPGVESADIFYNQCRFGSPYKKPTRLRVWGDLDLSSLGRLCAPLPQ